MPLPLPDWRAAGPERGHVVDVALVGDTVLALARPGVMRADKGLTSWTRDPRFPSGTRHLAAGKGGVWATTAAGLWRVEDTARRLTDLPGSAVALAAQGDAVWIAVRGPRAGVYRWDGTLTRVLEADPWTFAVDGPRVWAGTLDHGLCTLVEGSFQCDEGTAVSALAQQGGQLWVGRADGSVRGATLACTTAGPPLAISFVHGRALVLVDSEAGPLHDLAWCGDGTTEALVPPDGAERERFKPSGLWSITPDLALLGSFREGPFRVDADGVRPARTGFRATLTSAAVVAGDRLLLALMSSGIYSSEDAAASWAPLVGADTQGDAPVTDAMDLAVDGERVLVVDFDGIVTGRKGRWYRSRGMTLPDAGRPNALVEVATGPDHQLWGRDYAGGVWTQGPDGWTACATHGVARLDGWGDDLLLATRTGWLRPTTCAAEATPVLPGDATRGRSDGHWAVLDGRVLRDGAPITTWTGDPAAIVADGDAVLIAGDGSAVDRCAADGCTALTAPLPSRPVAIGRFADGRVWAAEAEGSLLIADATTPLPPAHAKVTADGRASLAWGVAGPAEDVEQAIPPWRKIGRADWSGGKAPAAPIGGPAAAAVAAAPTPSRWTWVIAAEAIALVGVIAVAMRRRRRR